MDNKSGTPIGSYEKDKRYLEQAAAHACEGPLGEAAARDILTIALRLVKAVDHHIEEAGRHYQNGLSLYAKLHKQIGIPSEIESKLRYYADKLYIPLSARRVMLAAAEYIKSTMIEWNHNAPL